MLKIQFVQNVIKNSQKFKNIKFGRMLVFPYLQNNLTEFEKICLECRT